MYAPCLGLGCVRIFIIHQCILGFTDVLGSPHIYRREIGKSRCLRNKNGKDVIRLGLHRPRPSDAPSPFSLVLRRHKAFSIGFCRFRVDIGGESLSCAVSKILKCSEKLGHSHTKLRKRKISIPIQKYEIFPIVFNFGNFLTAHH